MTEKHKRYRIEQIDKYEEEIDVDEKNTSEEKFLAGIFSIAAVCCLSRVVNADTETTQRVLYFCVGLISTGIITLDSITNVIKAIGKTTIQKNQTIDTNNQLEMLENEESRGIRR